jgi:hypothetical protein
MPFYVPRLLTPSDRFMLGSAAAVLTTILRPSGLMVLTNRCRLMLQQSLRIRNRRYPVARRYAHYKPDTARSRSPEARGAGIRRDRARRPPTYPVGH